MYARWINKNVDLNMLASEIKIFFEQKGLSTEESEEPKKRFIIAKAKGSSKAIRITLAGSPQNFTVEGLFVEDRVPMYSSVSIFGGGGFLLRELKLREILHDLEKDFSVFLENLVIRLANSNYSDSAKP